MILADIIPTLTTLPSEALNARRSEALAAFADLRAALNRGDVRAAEPDAASPSGWKTNAWVKQGILLGFKLGVLEETKSAGPLQFFDKDTIPVRAFTAQDAIRIVPGGSSVRDGAFIAPGVIIMPPAYVNIGAYIGAGTL